MKSGAIRRETYRSLLDSLKELDQELAKALVVGEHFSELFFVSNKDEDIVEYIRGCYKRPT